MGRVDRDGGECNRAVRPACGLRAQRGVLLVRGNGRCCVRNEHAIGGRGQYYSHPQGALPEPDAQDSAGRHTRRPPSTVVVNAGSMSSPVKAITISIPKKSPNLEKVVSQMDRLKNSVARLNSVLSTAGTSPEDADSIAQQAAKLQQTLTSVKAVTGGVSTGQLIDSISRTAKQIKQNDA